MLELGPIAFAAPWVLAAAVALPIIWWLLRVTPPSPRLMAFPAIRFLLALRPQEETPQRTPWWLILLRLTLAALIILALAHPLLNPGTRLHGSGPLVIVVDNGWASAVNWPARTQALERLIGLAGREDRAVSIVATARGGANQPVEATRLMRASEALEAARTIAPQPWPTDPAATGAAVDALAIEGSAQVVWLSDGLGSAAAIALSERLQQLGSLRVLVEAPAARARLVAAPSLGGRDLTVPVRRVLGAGPESLTLRASAEDGRIVTRHAAAFADGETETRVTFDLPGEMRNEVSRIEIEGESTAGAVFLLDERWRRRPVGLIAGEAAERSQPLLSALYYLERALTPFSEARRGTLEELLEREVAVLTLADIGRLTDTQIDQLGRWMDTGGVLVRFAGPRLAQSADSLIPVKLRGGGRSLGGAMSWAQPLPLRPFDEGSPFAGLAVPDDVRISQQVLAEPSIDLDSKTWARLADGTPLVTAARRGQGWLVLIHTTAGTEWSNLPISGLFVQMLQRIVGLSQGVVSEDTKATFPPAETLDGFGRLHPPPSSATAIAGRAFADARPTPLTPPGFYGQGGARRALNLASGVSEFAPLGELPAGVEVADFGGAAMRDFKPYLLLAALCLALVDLAVSLALRGLMPLRRAAQIAGVLALAVIVAAPQSGQAQTNPFLQERRIPEGPDARALMATLETRLAYVLTGDASIDDTSRAGLTGLTDVLRRRTAVEPATPLGIDLERDELTFFPLLYWAVSPAQRPISDKATAKLNAYARSGGTILFDTREQGSLSGAEFGGGSATQRLRLLLRGLDVPALIPVPRDHVLTKAFYLLGEFPGRWANGTVWVERHGGRHNDGVSSVIIGSNDWAGAWAVDDTGRPLFPVVPGGEAQREMAFRFGVNWVMYALTGNYKTDQVHVPAIIERLGQ